MISIIEAIVAINPNAEVSVLDEDYNQITWIKGSPISEEDIRAKRAELQAEYDAKEYQRKRKAEYPSIRDCVHAILDDDLENLQILRQAVKDKFPKENS